MTAVVTVIFLGFYLIKYFWYNNEVENKILRLQHLKTVFNQEEFYTFGLTFVPFRHSVFTIILTSP